MDQRAVDRRVDPVCAMTVDPTDALRQGLALTYEQQDYHFCSAGCLLEFRADPAWFLDAAYVPTPM